MQSNLWEVFAAGKVSKNFGLPQVIYCHILRTVPKDFRSFSKFFQLVVTRYSVGTIPIHMLFFNRYIKLKMQIFDPVASDDTADITNVSQMMSYSHAEKVLNRNEHLNFIS